MKHLDYKDLLQLLNLYYIPDNQTRLLLNNPIQVWLCYYIFFYYYLLIIIDHNSIFTAAIILLLLLLLILLLS